MSWCGGKVEIMKRLQMTVMFAVVLTAIMAASASAETTLLAEWLDTGVPVNTLTSVENIWSVIFGDTKLGLRMRCSVTEDGSVGSNGEYEVTEWLVNGVAVSLSKRLVCTGLEGCEAPAEIAPEDLPWHSLMYLTEAGDFVGIQQSSSFYSAKCKVLGISTEEECSPTLGTFRMENGASGVIPTGEVTPLGSCSVGGAGSGQQIFQTGSLTKALSGTLSVSE
jgi:hypothetical protein